MSTKQAATKYKRLKCVVPGCKNCRQSRGLCHSCYTGAEREIKAGRETWESLEEKGLSIPAGLGRKRSIAFHAALKQANSAK